MTRLDGRSAEPPLTVWYDGDCPLCSREIDWMRRQTAGLPVTYVDLRLPMACPGDRAAFLGRFHVQERGRGLVSGAPAFATLWRRTRALRWAGLLAQWPSLMVALGAAYSVFLFARPVLQRLVRRGARNVVHA